MISLKKLFKQEGQGHHGHKGRPGQVGGSSPGSGSDPNKGSKTAGSGIKKPSKPKKMVGAVYKGTYVAISKDGNVLGTNFETDKKAKGYIRRELPSSLSSEGSYEIMTIESAVEGGWIEPNSLGIVEKKKKK